MELHDLEVYKLARELSRDSWNVYRNLDWQTKKIIGDQWIRATDSVAANIAEAFGRYHYLDKNKFHFNARGSLFEALHWLELLEERKQIEERDASNFKLNIRSLGVKLNNFIRKIRNDASEQPNHKKSRRITT